MAATAAGQLLTEQHRRQQLGIRAATLRQLLIIWPAFTLDDIDGSWPSVEASLLALIAARRRQSTDVAANYFRTFRAVERVPGEATPRRAPEPDRTLLVATLRLMGPIGTKKSISAGVTNPAARTLTRLSGSVARQVLNGGRDTLTESARADPAANGWQRITSSSPCKFCADIADQGVVGLDVDFPAHDHCACTQEVAY